MIHQLLGHRPTIIRPPVIDAGEGRTVRRKEKINRNGKEKRQKIERVGGGSRLCDADAAAGRRGLPASTQSRYPGAIYDSNLRSLFSG